MLQPKTNVNRQSAAVAVRCQFQRRKSTPSTDNILAKTDCCCDVVPCGKSSMTQRSL